MDCYPKILLVDDEQRFAESLQQLLEAQKYHSTIALNGKKALELLQENTYDLILLDVDLPDMNGVQAIDFIKTYLTTTPIIMMTGNSSVETAVAAMKKGAWDYLKKPIVHHLLFTTIGKAIRHVKLKKDLHESEKRFKTLSEASWEGILIHNNGLLIEANNQFYEMFGYEKNQLLGTHILDKVFDKKSFHIVLNRIKKGVLGSHESVGVKKDGSTFPIESRTSYIDFQGQKLRVCAIRDITERKKTEKEKLKLQMQLAKTSKMEALGLMAGSVAHDLNNILAGIVSFPEVLLMEMDKSDKNRESILTIQDAGKRAASVVSDLITIARGETTLKSVKNPNAIITSHLSSIEHKDYVEQYPEINISTDLDDNLLNAHCSGVHISKAIMNLIGNAMEAMEKKGLIAITTKNENLKKPIVAYEKIPAGEYVKITIADNGPGIPPRDLDHIFEPFYSKKVMARSGTGLGLAIVWSTVHDHNGYINVISGRGGTAFEIYLPATYDVEYTNNSALSINALRGNGEAILVVDDQETQCLIARNILNNIGYDTLSVNSGEDALKICRKNRVDLVILDMILEHGMNGRETYEQLLKINPKQKAIVISGFSENDELKRIEKLGVSHFIKKPYTLDQLGLAVKQSLIHTPSRRTHM